MTKCSAGSADAAFRPSARLSRHLVLKEAGMKFKLAIAAAFAFSIPLFGVHAVVTPASVAATIDLSPTCVDTNAQSLFAGRWPATASNEQGVSALIDAPYDTGYFIHCTGTEFLPQNGAQGWVALKPQSGVGNGATVLQAGVIDCELPNNPSVCNTAGRWFWAAGGCNNANPLPYDISADTHPGPDKFTVRIYSTSVQILINDNVVVNFPRTAGNQYWDRISCWASGSLDMVISAERWDHGDWVGYFGADELTFSSMKRYYTGAWHDLTGTTCEAVDVTNPNPYECTALGTTLYISQ